MEALAEYFAMGGYSAFVWPAYGIAAGVLIALLALSLRDLRRNESEAQALRRQRRAGAEGEAET